MIKIKTNIIQIHQLILDIFQNINMKYIKNLEEVAMVQFIKQKILMLNLVQIPNNQKLR